MSAHEQSRVMGLVLLSETAHPFTPQGHCQGMMKPVLTSSVPLKDDKLPPFEARLLGSASRLLATHWGLDGERPSPYPHLCQVMPPRKASVWPLRGGLEAARAAVALMPLCGGRGQAGESGQRGPLLAGGTLEAEGRWGGTPTL